MRAHLPLSLGAALVAGGCALIVGIEDHHLATTTTMSAGGGGTGGAGGTGTGTGGQAPNDCPPPDVGPTPCAAGLADCDGEGSCETTLATDGVHCGACGHDCLGGACQASVCREVALTPAYAPAEAFGPMTVHAGRVYYAAGPHEANLVYSAPVDGGAAPKVVSSGPVGEVYHIAVYSDTQADFLFVTAHDGAKWIIHGMLADGGTPNDIANLSSFSTGFAAGADGTLYVAEESHILAIAFSPDEIVTSPDPIRGMAIDGQYVYWSSWPDTGSGMGKVSRATLTGGAPTVLADGLGKPGEIALDEAHVYWTDSEASTLSRTLKSGGAPEALVTGQSVPRYLAVVGDDLFFSAEGGLYRARLCALGQKPIRLTSDVAGALSADAQRVYATDMQFHQVVGFAR